MDLFVNLHVFTVHTNLHIDFHFQQRDHISLCSSVRAVFFIPLALLYSYICVVVEKHLGAAMLWVYRIIILIDLFFCAPLCSQ